MSRVRPPDNIEIASLKKKQRTVFDPMVAGGGTPWEDRATHGTLGAFIKTCLKSLTAPGELTRSIRRPETTTDARGFVIGVSIIWVISALMHFTYFVWRETKAQYEPTINTVNTGVLALLTVVLSGGGVFFLFKIYTKIYGKLTATEKDAVLMPEVLLYNVNAYALGPSLLALIPFAGPPIALLWIFIDLIAVGNKRLRLRLSASVIDALISLAAVLAIAGGIYFLGKVIIMDRIVHYDAVDPGEPPPTAK
jgi:hypothetical protein